jgi:hypothetical protein
LLRVFYGLAIGRVDRFVQSGERRCIDYKLSREFNIDRM